MKTGDKILCTHDFYSNLQRMFTTNKIYTITHINEYMDIIRIKNDRQGEQFFYTSQQHSLYQFKDYFIPHQEYRKQKLLKLNSK